MINYTQTITQTITGDWSVQNVFINFAEFIANVRFKCMDSNGVLVDTFAIDYLKTDNTFGYDYFWQNFNSGLFLLQELIRVKGWVGINIPNNIEQDFLSN